MSEPRVKPMEPSPLLRRKSSEEIIAEQVAAGHGVIVGDGGNRNEWICPECLAPNATTVAHCTACGERHVTNHPDDQRFDLLVFCGGFCYVGVAGAAVMAMWAINAGNAWACGYWLGTAFALVATAQLIRLGVRIERVQTAQLRVAVKMLGEIKRRR